MVTMDMRINITYEEIGGTHLLVHMYHPKFINQWMLLDLEDLARKSGKSIDEVIERLSRKEAH